MQDSIFQNIFSSSLNTIFNYWTTSSIGPILSCVAYISLSLSLSPCLYVCRYVYIILIVDYGNMNIPITIF